MRASTIRRAVNSWLSSESLLAQGQEWISMTMTNQKKNTIMPGTACPATVLALAMAASHPPSPHLFAFHGHPQFLNVQVAGWVIMANWSAGMLVPRSGYDAVRRRIVHERYRPAGQVTEIGQRRYPSYLRLNPASKQRLKQASRD